MKAKSQRLIVANWKMNKPFGQVVEWFGTHGSALTQLAASPSTELVLCPSYESLYYVHEQIQGTGITLGAQDCSSYQSGAYTGQVSAISLAQVGCNYCIIGHSERRKYNQESAQDVAQKLLQLLTALITPIICIGETTKNLSSTERETQLREQLAPINEILSKADTPHTQLVFAYEPAWAIGSGDTPSIEHVTEVINWLRDYCTPLSPEFAIRILYGGSVDEKVLFDYQEIEQLDGFLVGSASLDFTKLQKIVS